MADDLGDDWWQKSSKNKLNLKDKKKRKREDIEDVNNDIIESKPKPAKKKMKKEIVEADLSADEVEPAVNDSKSKKHRKKKTKSFEGTLISTPEAMIEVVDNYFSDSLSAVEKTLVKLEAGHFSACNDGSHTIVSLMKSLFPKWKRALKTNSGEPRKPIIVIVCSSALRCLEVIKQMAELKCDQCIIAKLFAKHMKLEETQSFLKTKVIHIAVGTPNRLHSLISSGDLLLDSVQQVILDASHKDVKKCTIFDIKIVKSDLMKLLADCFIPHVKKHSIEVDTMEIKD